MSWFSKSVIGIDLGNSVTTVYASGKGIVLTEPTMVLVEKENRKHVLAVGSDVRELVGRTSRNMTVVMPVVDGVVQDYELLELYIRSCIHKAIGYNHVRKPVLLVSVPVGISQVNRQMLERTVNRAGANKVYLIDKPFAAAIGSGLSIFEPTGHMVVDIGAGTTDAAVISLGGMVVSHSVAVGGKKMDESIVGYFKKEFNMLISPGTAERIKIDLASAISLNEERHIPVRGTDLLSPKPVTVDFTSSQAYSAVREPCRSILSCIKWVLERTPPELSGDVMRTGIHLTGGASQLFAIDRYIATELGIPVLMAKKPEDCTAIGLGFLAENMHLVTSHEEKKK